VSFFGRFPVYGWIGLVLMGITWGVNWSLTGPRTHILFFPLWFGYCLTVDGLTVWRNGDSLIRRGRLHYIYLFVLSAGLWWLFEWINLRTQNWIYLGGEHLSWVEHGFWASLDFSTVVPAVFGTAVFLGTFFEGEFRRSYLMSWNEKVIHCYSFLLGLSMLVLVLVFPKYFYPCVWLSIIFILDPINFKLGRPTLLRFIRQGYVKPLVCLAIGTLICGFFWEMWNAFSWPKWIYHVSFFGFWKIFEMPLLGYLGYLPFGLELFVAYHFVTGFSSGYQRDLLGEKTAIGP